MPSRSESIDSAEYGSQLFNHGNTREETKKKISFHWHRHITIHLLLGVGLNLADIIGDIYSSVQLYNQQYEGNNTTQNITQIDGNSWHFPMSICLLVIPSLFIMCFSLVTYWREAKWKLVYKGWGLLRLACPFPFSVLASVVRYYLIIIYFSREFK